MRSRERGIVGCRSLQPPFFSAGHAAVHFLVVKDAAPGERVYSIDGNVGNPSEATVSPWNSVISKRFYLRTTLASKGGKFLRPKFGAMTG